jgi:hypothetical protein
MCPNSSNGEHSYQLTTIPYPNGPVVVKICMLCQQEG